MFRVYFYTIVTQFRSLTDNLILRSLFYNIESFFSISIFMIAAFGDLIKYSIP